MTEQNGNPLSARSLAAFIAASLPRDTSPQLKTPYEAVALVVHAGMIAVGFRLVGLGEDHKIDAHADATDARPLPSEWNQHSSYAFRYAHSQSSMEYLIKVNRLGGKAVVFGLAMGDDKTAQFEVTVKDYISEGNLPATPRTSDTPTDAALNSVLDIFISEGRLSDLGSLLKISVLQKLAPGIRKEGYEEEASSASASDTREQERERRRGPERPVHDPLRDPVEPAPARPHPLHDPLAAPRRDNRPLPEPIPGFDDELDINRSRGGVRAPGQGALGDYGYNDLYPQGLGPRDPINGGAVGGFGGLPRPGGMGGGMHPTFDDPLFGGNGGVGGYDPQAPPGARYDPIGPGGAPRDNRGGFPGGGGMGGRPPNPFGGYGSGDFI